MFKLQTLFVASLEEVKEFFPLYSFFFFFFSGFVLEASGSFASSSFSGFANRNMHAQAHPQAKGPPKLFNSPRFEEKLPKGGNN